MEKLKPTSKVFKTVGKHLKCRFCESPDAYIYQLEGRYMVSCPVCQSNYYLKEQHI